MAKIDQGKIRDFIEECSLMILEHNDMIDYGLNDKEIDWLIKEDYIQYNYISDYYFWINEEETYDK